MALRRIRDPLSKFQLKLLCETIRPHLPTCRFPDFEISASPVPVPAAWHFVYFPSLHSELMLYSDGYDPVLTDVMLNGLSKRRWRGGTISFAHKEPLLSDHPSTCTISEEVSVVRSTNSSKISPLDWEKVDEHTVRTMMTDGGENASVVEQRHLTYLPVGGLVVPVSQKKIKANYTPIFETNLTPSRVLVFRFSALTFNAHRIHYDPLYATSFEGLPDVILQGALSLTLLMSWIQFDDNVAQALMISAGLPNPKRIASIQYSCVQNIFVDKEIRLCLAPRKGMPGKYRAWIEQDGGVCLKGTIAVE
ncbi:hypothetical protein BZA70DRAFT_270467 [Myxozyma melibiosi]|uniref:MaoC-like domain-containing protein n=1 Tax=Myxozyma melibiosi TaxID=54550 RepID=A0ABR1FDG0_9ASCO